MRKIEIENDLGADQRKIENQIGSEKSRERAADNEEARRALKKGITSAPYRTVFAQMFRDLSPNTLA